MKPSDIKTRKGMDEYCSRGLAVEPKDIGIILTNKAICKLEEIPFGDGFVATRYSTWEAEQYWILTKDRKLSFISTKFDSVKSVVFTLRRSNFTTETHPFLEEKQKTKAASAAEALNNIEI